MINILQAASWQMTTGERSALEGILSQLKPTVAIEIGTAEGGSLACIAAHAAEVHSFDLVEPALSLEALPHVSVHTGDSHQKLPELLSTLGEAGTNVDFALVDGDHTAPGVKRDIEDLLGSPAVSRTIVLIHDTANETVRAGLEAVDYGAWPKVRSLDLDFVPGYLVKADTFHHEIWGGLGLLIVDESTTTDYRPHPLTDLAYPITTVLAEYRTTLERPADDGTPSVEVADLRAHTTDLERRLTTILNSHSWKITAPLRRLAARLRA